MAGAPKNNKNAEKWTEEEAVALMTKALNLSRTTDIYYIGKDAKEVQGYSYHFLGEIAVELDTYTDIFLYLKGQYEPCKELYNRIKAQCEANCFSDSKKGIIKEATAIMNLKSNYKWTDRVDSTSKGEAVNQSPVSITFKDSNEED